MARSATTESQSWPRGDLAIELDVESDCRPLAGLVAKILDACPEVRCMRDPTRGGLASTLNEFAL